jgi:photosynthetic reaction center H subunit
MPTGAITDYIDVAQLTLYAFWIFFAGLVIYLRREDKREGYPLESERSGSITVQGWPSMPVPKSRLLKTGMSPLPNNAPDPRPLAARPTGPWLGAPLEPTGNPMLDGVGPAAYANRADVPDVTIDGVPRIVPLRVTDHHAVASQDPDPRGMAVLGADGETGGTVRDIWVDRSEEIFRYLEVAVPTPAGGRNVLLPINFTRIDGKHRQVKVASILGAQFAQVPAHRHADQVTLLEEDRIMGYYGGGTLYAEPSRREPLI